MRFSFLHTRTLEADDRPPPKNFFAYFPPRQAPRALSPRAPRGPKKNCRCPWSVHGCCLIRGAQTGVTQRHAGHQRALPCWHKRAAPPPTHPPVHQKALQTQQAHSDTKTTTSKTTPEIALRRPQGDALGSQSQYSQPQQAVPPHAPLRSASAFLPSGGVSAQFCVGYPWVSVGIRGYPPPFVRQRYASCIMKVSKTQGAGAMRGSNLEFQRGIRPGEANAL